MVNLTATPCYNTYNATDYTHVANHTTIVAAINNATNGDIILVCGHNYEAHTGTIVVNKSVNIFGNQSGIPLNSSDYVQAIFTINASYVNISNFSMFGNGSSVSAVNFTSDASNVRLFNNILYNFTTGVLMKSGSHNITLTSNTLYNMSTGIYLSASDDNTFTSNTLYDVQYAGIILSTAERNTFTSNNMYNIRYGSAQPAINTFSAGIALNGTSNTNTFTSNIIQLGSSKGILLADDTHNNTFTSNVVNNSQGIYLDGSDDNTFTSNKIHNQSSINYVPNVVLDGAERNTFTSNTIVNGTYGFLFNGTAPNGNIFTSNTIAQHTTDGILLPSGSHNNTFTSNTLHNDTIGIYLSASDDNTFTSNTILNSSSYGVIVDSGADRNTFASNTISNTTDTNVFLNGTASRNTFTSNTIFDAGVFGVMFGNETHNNTFVSNTVYSDVLGGFFVNGTDHTFTSNTLYGYTSTVYGAFTFVDGAVRNVFTSNTMYNVGKGLYLTGEAGKLANITLLNFKSNTIYNFSVYGIHLENVSDHLLFAGDNTVYRAVGTAKHLQLVDALVNTTVNYKVNLQNVSLGSLGMINVSVSVYDLNTTTVTTLNNLTGITVMSKKLMIGLAGSMFAVNVSNAGDGTTTGLLSTPILGYSDVGIVDPYDEFDVGLTVVNHTDHLAANYDYIRATSRDRTSNLVYAAMTLSQFQGGRGWLLAPIMYTESGTTTTTDDSTKTALSVSYDTEVSCPANTITVDVDVANAEITLLTSEGYSVSSKESDSTGAVTFTISSSGDYKVKATKRNYASTITDVFTLTLCAVETPETPPETPPEIPPVTPPVTGEGETGTGTEAGTGDEGAGLDAGAGEAGGEEAGNDLVLWVVGIIVVLAILYFLFKGSKGYKGFKR